MLPCARAQVRVYNERHLVSVHSVPSPVTGLWAGRYGREDNTLVTVLRSGALDIKVRALAGRVPGEQDVGLVDGRHQDVCLGIVDARVAGGGGL
eukprot:17400-Chlamydomonas_euryale.AAC.2